MLNYFDAVSDQCIYRTRTGGHGTHYASPLIASDKLYTTASDGRISVLALGKDFKILATNEMDDGVFPTPAITDGTI